MDSADEALAAPYSSSAALEEAEGGGNVTVGVGRADGAKCARCWNYRWAGGRGGGQRAGEPVPGRAGGRAACGCQDGRGAG